MLNASNSDNQQSIFVRATPIVENNQDKDLITVSRICSALSSGLIVYRLVFYSQWLDRFELNQLSIVAITLVLFATCYLLMFRLVKFGIKQMCGYVAPEKQIQAHTVRGWLLSESIIQRQFDNYVQSFSATTIKCMNADDDGLDLHFKSGEQDRLEKAGFSSPEDFADAQTMLTQAMILDSSVQQPPEAIENEQVVSGGYTKAEADALLRYSSQTSSLLSRHTKVHIGLVILMLVTFFSLHYFSANGIRGKTFLMAGFMYFFAFGSSHMAGWQMKTAARAYTHRWSLSSSGFTFCTFHQNGYKMISRSWDQLERFEQNEVGLFLTFGNPELITLIPAWLVSPELLAELNANANLSSKS